MKKPVQEQDRILFPDRRRLLVRTLWLNQGPKGRETNAPRMNLSPVFRPAMLFPMVTR